MGQVSLAQLEEANIWSLAFWIHPDCWGQGYATEIAGRIVKFAFVQLSAHKVWAAAAICNPASLRVLQKLGMDYLGESKEGYRINDRPIPTKEYALEVGQFDRLKG
jgi:ribosomal-protein-alanine N-acetyltransferase